MHCSLGLTVESIPVMLWIYSTCSVIGPENSRHPVNQSGSKVKTISIRSFTFSRASSSQLVFTLNSHRLMRILHSDWSLGLFWFFDTQLRNTDKKNSSVSFHVHLFVCLYICFSLSSFGIYCDRIELSQVYKFITSKAQLR